jgi:hypothetical protein
MDVSMNRPACHTPRAWSWRRVHRFLPLLGLLAALNVDAHEFLTRETLDDAIERIRDIGEELSASDGAVSADDVYRLGNAAEALALLINEDVRAHGFDQQELIFGGLDRAAALGVDIDWSAQHKRFFYDGAAWRRYIELAPGGTFAADSRYHLIERNFYLAPADTIDSLRASAAVKVRFLDDYPRFREAARVALFLGIDYRDLYRLCLEQPDSNCKNDYAERATEQFAQIASRYAGSDTAEIADRFLARLEGELAATAE